MEINKKYGRATPAQLRYYVEFARNHPDLLHGKNCPKLWQEMADTLNAMVGAKRTPQFWKEAMRNWRKQLHSRARKIVKHNRAGSGPSSIGKLSEFELHTLEVFGLAVVDGHKVTLRFPMSRAVKIEKAARRKLKQPYDTTDAASLGKLWANEYRFLPADQQLLVKRAIKEIFSDSKMRTLRPSDGPRTLLAEQVPTLSKRKVLRSYIGLLLEDNIPVEILDSPNMRNLVEPLCTALAPDNKTAAPLQLNTTNCRQALSLVATEVRRATTSQLRQRLISLKIDSLSSSSNIDDTATHLNDLFTLSAQYIHADRLETHVLGLLEIKSNAADSFNRNATLLSTLRKYQIDYDQVATLTMDSDAAHALNDVDALHTFLAADADASAICTTHDNDDDQIEVQHYAAHTAQLCTLALQDDAEIRAYIANCRQLTQFVQKSTTIGMHDIFAILGHGMPKLDCATRWSSTYTMIEALLAARDTLNDAMTDVKMQTDDDDEKDDNVQGAQDKNKDVATVKCLLTPALWAFCEAYVCILGPLQKTVRKYEEEQNDSLHFGNFYARWLKCKIQTQKLLASSRCDNNNNNNLRHKLGRSLLACIERATTALLANECFSACLFMDPRFHNTLKPAQKTQSIRYLQKLWTKVNACNVRNAATSSENVVSATANAGAGDPLVQNEFSDDEDAMLNEFLSKELQQQQPDCVGADMVRQKIEQLQLPFVRSDANVLQFWLEKQHTEPELFALSNICFAIPTVRVPFERASCSLPSGLKNGRNCHSVDTLEDMLLIQLNPYILDEAIESLPLFHAPAEEMTADHIKFEIVEEMFFKEQHETEESYAGKTESETACSD